MGTYSQLWFLPLRWLCLISSWYKNSQDKESGGLSLANPELESWELPGESPGLISHYNSKEAVSNAEVIHINLGGSRAFPAIPAGFLHVLHLRHIPPNPLNCATHTQSGPSSSRHPTSQHALTMPQSPFPNPSNVLPQLKWQRRLTFKRFIVSGFGINLCRKSVLFQDFRSLK